MKKYFFIFPVLACLALADCKKAKGPASVPSVQQNNGIDSQLSMNATINGQAWATDSAYSYRVKHSGNDSLFDLMITATQSQQAPLSTITFNIGNYSGPKTYTINPPINTAAYYAGNSRHYATTGQVVITIDNNILKGTFNFKADTFTVASGTFKVAQP